MLASKNALLRMMRGSSVLLLGWFVALLGCPSKSQPVRDGANTPSKGMTLQLAQSSLRLGERMDVLLKNEGSQTYTYDFPGGNNGCVLPIYRVMLKHEKGDLFLDTYVGPNRKCTQQVVPPQQIVIEAGRSYTLRLDTGMVWYLAPKKLSGRAQRQPLPLGRYQVIVQGGNLRLTSADLTLQAKP